MKPSLKMRAILAASGLLAGLAGAGALAWAAIAALVPWLGVAGASAVVGLILAAAAGLSMWLAFKPDIPLEQEFEGLTQAAQDAFSSAKDDALESLTELPLNVLNRMIEEHPVTSLLGVAMAAYTVTRSPAASAGVIDKVLSRLI